VGEGAGFIARRRDVVLAGAPARMHPVILAGFCDARLVAEEE
jgi:hypothetical protein